jgi:hypothetical protein
LEGSGGNRGRRETGRRKERVGGNLVRKFRI